jgi:ketosteroid isomerase-like protein
VIRRLPLWLGVALAATTAVADPKQPPKQAAAPAPTAEVVQRVENLASRAQRPAGEAPKVAFTGNLTLDAPGSLDDATLGMPDVAIADPKMTLALVVDTDTAIVSTNLGEYYGCDAKCGKPVSDSWLRATAVLEKHAGAWQPLAWSITPSIRSTSQQDAAEDKIVPDKLARNIAGAEDVVKQFETTIGDPKAFAATFSQRKDAVMMGSELAERFVGAKAKAQILAWNMGFTVRDGVRAGVSKTGNVAWLAANVDAKSLKRANADAIPFRMFVVFEKVGTEKTAPSWTVVHVQFSTAV